MEVMPHKQLEEAVKFVTMGANYGGNPDAIENVRTFLKNLHSDLLTRISELEPLNEIYKVALSHFMNSVDLNAPFFAGGDPRNFHPNAEGWSDQQKKNYREDCERWKEQEFDPSEPWYLAETDPYRYGPGVHLKPSRESKEANRLLASSDWELLVANSPRNSNPAT
jgi:hypothetical protein